MYVLLYDHSAVLLARFQDRLLSAGYRVTARFPREMTIEQVRKHAPDVIVLGLTAEAGTGGLEKLRLVRDHPTTVHIPAIIATEAGTDIPVPFDDVMVRHVEFTVMPFNCDQVLAELEQLRRDAR